MDRIRGVFKNEQGAAVIIWASFMLMLMSLFAALLLETGDLLMRKHMVQAAADASVLSGAAATDIIFEYDPFSKTVLQEVTVLRTDDLGGGTAQLMAEQTLEVNKNDLEFDRRKIEITDADIDGDGLPEPGVRYIAGSPVLVTAMDGTVKTYYQSYGIVLNGYMEAPLWGSLFGDERLVFSITAAARPDRD